MCATGVNVATPTFKSRGRTTLPGRNNGARCEVTKGGNLIIICDDRAPRLGRAIVSRSDMMFQTVIFGENGRFCTNFSHADHLANIEAVKCFVKRRPTFTSRSFFSVYKLLHFKALKSEKVARNRLEGDEIPRVKIFNPSPNIWCKLNVCETGKM